jgi:Activator of Hsp90 ATPase homolog 1-like protein
MSELRFVPRTAYVIYIASTPERVWEALTGPEFTRQYFSGRSVEIEPKVGGSFVMRMPDGRFDIKGRWSGIGRAGCRSPGRSISRNFASCRHAW